MAFWTINHPGGGLWNIFSFLCKLLILARIFHFRGFWVLLEGGTLWFVTKIGLFLSSTWSLNCPIGGLWKKYHSNWDRLVLGNLKAAIAQNWFMYACFLDISHAKRSIIYQPPICIIAENVTNLVIPPCALLKKVSFSLYCTIKVLSSFSAYSASIRGTGKL